MLQEIKWKLDSIKRYFSNKHYKRLYPDYQEDGYNFGNLKFIWGVTSWDDLSGKDANLYTMNDIDITYNRKEKKYYLGIETAYLFKDKKAECDYLKQLLNAFNYYMDSNNLSKEDEFVVVMSSVDIKYKADTIEELYTNFRIFVEGFCKIYEN